MDCFLPKSVLFFNNKNMVIQDKHQQLFFLKVPRNLKLECHEYTSTNMRWRSDFERWNRVSFHTWSSDHWLKTLDSNLTSNLLLILEVHIRLPLIINITSTQFITTYYKTRESFNFKNFRQIQHLPVLLLNHSMVVS